MSRLFIAAYPPADVRAEIDDLPRAVTRGVRWVPASQWHVTLRFLGEADEDRAVAALQALGSQPVAHAELGPSVGQLGVTIVCLPVHGLDAVARAVAVVCEGVGEPVEERPFVGHLTLARIRGGSPLPLVGERFSASFEVGALVLVRSWLTPDGANHEVIETQRLGG